MFYQNFFWVFIGFLLGFISAAALAFHIAVYAVETGRIKPGVGGFTGPLSRLRTMGIIDYPESGRAIAESFLFLS